MLDRIFGHWRTTLLGVLGLLAVVVPPLQSWLQATLHLNTQAVLALVLAILGAVSTDPNKAA